MNDQKIKTISAALYHYSVADFNLELLEKVSINDLIFIVNKSNNERSEFRAAWALEHLLIQNNGLLTVHKNKIIQIYLKTKNWSVLRSVSKIIMALLKEHQQYDFHLDEEIQGLLIDKSFKIIANKDCPIAVRCNLYDIVYLSSKNEKWILKELKTQIYFDLEKSSTPALLSRATRILKRISQT